MNHDYLIGLHLDLHPYNKMEFTEALRQIKKHCNIPVDYVSKYEKQVENFRFNAEVKNGNLIKII
jgi:hypothetical protein